MMAISAGTTALVARASRAIMKKQAEDDASMVLAGLLFANRRFIVLG